MRVFKGRYRTLIAATVLLLVGAALAVSFVMLGSTRSSPPEWETAGATGAVPPPAPPGPARTRPDEKLAVLDRAVIGSAGISAPRTAVVARPFRVILRVDTKGLDTVLKSLANDLPENETRVGAGGVRLTPRMSATLVGSDCKVTPEYDSPVQAVSGTEPTTWSWLVEAATPGTLYLSVTLSQILTVEGKEVGRYHEFSRTVQVEAKPFSVREFVGAYWQWLGTIVIIPLAKALWDRWSRSRKPVPAADGPSRSRQ